MRIEPLGSAALMLRIEAGERIPDVLLAWVKTQPFRAAAVQGIGAVAEAEIGFFDPETRRYEKIHLPEQMEVLSLLGNLSLDPQGAPFFHLHVVLGRPDGSTLGGHLFYAVARPTLEIVFTPLPGVLRRAPDPDSGLNLLDLGQVFRMAEGR